MPAPSPLSFHANTEEALAFTKALLLEVFDQGALHYFHTFFEQMRRGIMAVHYCENPVQGAPAALEQDPARQFEQVKWALTYLQNSSRAYGTQLGEWYRPEFLGQELFDTLTAALPQLYDWFYHQQFHMSAIYNRRDGEEKRAGGGRAP